MKELAIAFVVSVAFLVGIFYGMAELEEAQCSSRWAASGVPSKWGWFHGCVIDPKKDGRWIPETAYREIQ